MHGAEIPEDGGGVAYAAGFMIATALLHLAGISPGFLIRRVSITVPLLCDWSVDSRPWPVWFFSLALSNPTQAFPHSMSGDFPRAVARSPSLSGRAPLTGRSGPSTTISAYSMFVVCSLKLWQTGYTVNNNVSFGQTAPDEGCKKEQ